MFPRLARALPSQPVEVPHYTATGQRDGLPLLTRAEGSTRFDPAVLSAEDCAAQHGELLGLVAVAAALLPDDLSPEQRCLVQIGRAVVALHRLTPQRAGGPYEVAGVYETEDRSTP